MKTVLTTSNVAHAWANQLQSEGRSNGGGSLYFNGATIYSYGSHFPIARHVINQKGENAVLFTERSYSNTTSKHIGKVRHAANHLNIIYCYNPEATHEQNLTSWLKEVEHIASNLVNARKPEKYLNQIEEVNSKVREFTTFFGISIPVDLEAALAIVNTEDYLKFKASREELRIAAETQAIADYKKKHEEELEKWLNGEIHTMNTRIDRDYLRVSGEHIQTSQGITMTREEALAIYYKLQREELKAGDKLLEGYEVKKINGDVTIGCHNFGRSYLLSFGESLLK